MLDILNKVYMCVSICLHSSMTSRSNLNNCYHQFIYLQQRSMFLFYIMGLNIILSGVHVVVASYIINIIIIIMICCFHFEIVRDSASVDMRAAHTAIDHYYYELNTEYS